MLLNHTELQSVETSGKYRQILSPSLLHHGQNFYADFSTFLMYIYTSHIKFGYLTEQFIHR